MPKAAPKKAAAKKAPVKRAAPIKAAPLKKRVLKVAVPKTPKPKQPTMRKRVGFGSGKAKPKVILSAARAQPLAPPTLADPLLPSEPVKPSIGKFAPPPLLDATGTPLPSWLLRPDVHDEVKEADTPAKKIRTTWGGGVESKLSPEIVKEICTRVAEGEALTVICKSEPERFPTAGTFLYWVGQSAAIRKPSEPTNMERQYVGIAVMWAAAVEARKEIWAEQYLEIISEPRKGKRVTKTESQQFGRAVKIETYDNTDRAKAHAGGIQWLLTKLHSKFVPPRQHVDLDPNTVNIHGGLPPENVPESSEEDLKAEIEQVEYDDDEFELAQKLAASLNPFPNSVVEIEDEIPVKGIASPGDVI